MADATSKLCKSAASSCVLGLPHVLRTVSKDGEGLACSPAKNAKDKARGFSCEHTRSNVFSDNAMQVHRSCMMC